MRVGPFRAELVGKPEMRESRFGVVCDMLMQPVELVGAVVRCTVTGRNAAVCESLLPGAELEFLGGRMAGPYRGRDEVVRTVFVTNEAVEVTKAA